jgi:FMN phosphatase YigB (HAD superfamily)
MKLRAVISDIYNTLLEVGPPPAAAAERWEFLWEDKLADPARLTLEEFEVECEKIVAREHAAAILVGVQYPEIYWPAVAKEALPELARLGEAERDEFLYQHAKLLRTVRLMPGAAEALSELARRNVLLGLISNCQPYTLRELDGALSAAELSRALFRPELCFFSFANGFSKPNPHAFRVLRAELQAQGISPAEILMVGDRLVNDLEPAHAHGFQTWWLTTTASAVGHTGGDWSVFRQHVIARVAA